MTDAQLAECLRAFAISLDDDRLDEYVMLREAGDRLAALAKPCPLPEGSPLTPDALADIREEVALGLQDRSAARAVLKLMVRDLLGALDHACALNDRLECCLADVAMDQGYRLARADGVEAAIAVVERAIVHDNGKAHGALCVLRNDILSECGPADLPPHAQSLARLRRLEAALERIMAMNGLGDGGMPVVRGIAAESLKGGAS